jgi:hypothetical protein
MHGDTLLIDLENKFHCYMLGYFWADCYFGKDSKNKYRLVFEIVQTDFEEVKDILISMGFSKFSTRKRKNSKTPQSSAKMYGINKLTFFKNYKFDDKSNGCPLYFDLSEEMQSYFIKGLMDGDGTICLTKRNAFKVSCCGPYLQNWNFLEDFCIKNNIPFSIYKKIRKANHESHKKEINSVSYLEIRTLAGKKKFCEKICSDVGLSRKLKIYFRLKDENIKELGRPHKKDSCFCGKQKDIRSRSCRECSYKKM